jgi:hypothetical protein
MTKTGERRVVQHGSHVVVQVRQSDGTWWNIRVMTYAQARAEGLYRWERDGR